jgi:hypothetical protein
MKTSHALAVTLGILLCLMKPAHAAAEACNTYLFPQSVTDVSLATVRVDRLPILRDADGCPTAGIKCEGKAYLVNGNQVVASGAHGDYRCAAFFNGQHQTTGWVATDGLTPAPASPSKDDWAGTWKRVQGNAVVSIRKRAGQYVASGFVTYTVRSGNVRTGTADGTLRVTSSPTGTVASFTQNAGDPTSECKVILKQLGPWLLVNDGATEGANSGCGGMGVTFNGMFQRTQHATGARSKR